MKSESCFLGLLSFWVHNFIAEQHVRAFVRLIFMTNTTFLLFPMGPLLTIGAVQENDQKNCLARMAIRDTFISINYSLNELSAIILARHK
jgi:hypothetical protein